MAKVECVVPGCTRMVEEPNTFCLFHSVDSEFVGRVEAAIFQINEAEKARKTAKSAKKG